MRFLISFLVVSFSSIAWADDFEHECFIHQSIQKFGVETGYSSLTEGRSETFMVSRSEFEDTRKISVVSSSGELLGNAYVETGTTHGGPDGDVIRAQAYVEVFGNLEFMGLMASTLSPMAKSQRFFTDQIGDNLVMVTVNLQCGIKQ